MRLRIGTRGSQLALAQARGVARTLEHRGHEVEIEIVRTKGDADQTRPFAEVGAAGLFVREIETALLERRIDVAVHSYKDLPSISPDGLVIAAVPERVDPRDRLLVRASAHRPDANGLPLAPGVRVGTASARRQALVRHLRPDLELVLLRGNVPTRVQRLRDGELEAVLLARAGLERLDRSAALGEGESPSRAGLVECDLDPEVFVPAPSQGALALQTRSSDPELCAAITELDDPAAHRPVRAERSLLARIEAGCEVPFGAWCQEREGGVLELRAVLETEGALRRAHASGHDPEALAAQSFDALRPGETEEP